MKRSILFLPIFLVYGCIDACWLSDFFKSARDAREKRLNPDAWQKKINYRAGEAVNDFEYDKAGDLVVQGARFNNCHHMFYFLLEAQRHNLDSLSKNSAFIEDLKECMNKPAVVIPFPFSHKNALGVLNALRLHGFHFSFDRFQEAFECTLFGPRHDRDTRLRLADITQFLAEDFDKFSADEQERFGKLMALVPNGYKCEIERDDKYPSARAVHCSKRWHHYISIK